jgi:DNA (cytosine-5)-methyltransferase 1
MPRLLDLFCCAGGAGMGYHRAGFEVVGVDIKPQPRYPFEFHQADALDVLSRMLKGEKFQASDGNWYGIDDFDAIHASPPCQRYSTMTAGRWQDRIESHPDLIAPVRDLLKQTGRPYVIENVEGARAELINPILLCGTMFGLQTKHGSQLRRHRYFEMSTPMFLVPTCQHNNGSVIGVYGGGQNPARRRPATIGVWGHAGGSSARDGLTQFGTQDRRDAMGIDWMTGNELSEAIPPAYTEYIGKQLLTSLETL